MCELRKRGVAAAVICSELFANLAKGQSRILGASDLHRIVIPHPLGGLELDEVAARAEVALPQVLKFIRDPGNE